jgi:hypothetical protein
VLIRGGIDDVGVQMNVLDRCIELIVHEADARRKNRLAAVDDRATHVAERAAGHTHVDALPSHHDECRSSPSAVG